MLLFWWRRSSCAVKSLPREGEIVNANAKVEAKSFFVNPVEVINRSKRSPKLMELVDHAMSGGCQCVNCRSCDNSCNK